MAMASLRLVPQTKHLADDRRWMWRVAVFFVLAHLYLATTSANVLLDWFRYDDAFYYFKTAQNAVAGLGMTFDGTGPTNGFHPLWMLLLLPVYVLSRGDGMLALRGVVMLVGGLLALAAGVFFWAARFVLGRAGAWLGVGLLLFVPPLYLRLAAGGMESALSVATLMLFWAVQTVAQQHGRWQEPRWVAWVGMAAALAMLARLDNALVVAVVGLLWWYRWWRAGLSWRRQLHLALAFGLPGAVGVGGFLVWSRWYVGTWMPVSSQVKVWWGSLVDTPYGRAMRYRILRTLLRLADPAARGEIPWRMVWGSGMLVLGVVGSLVGGRAWLRRRPAAVKWLRRTALDGMTLGAGLHYAYMVIASGLSPLRLWYWTPETVVSVLWLAALVGGMAQRWRWWRWGVVVAALGFAWWLGWTYPPRRATLHPYLHQARWVEAQTEPGAVIGAAGSGTLGYFVRQRRVLNLDGLISTPAYLEALQEGRGVDYLQAQGLRYVLGAFWLTKLNPYRQVFAHRLQPLAEYRYQGVKATLYLFLP